MKKIAIIIFFFGFSFSSKGQQFLWSTFSDTSLNWGEHISLNDVSSKVIEYYDHYELHFDGTGFSKNGFVESFERSKSFRNTNQNIWKKFKSKLFVIKELTVFAFKSNSGKGSQVLIFCISKNNVDMIVFSNDYDDGARLNFESDRDKFETWLSTLLK